MNMHTWRFIDSGTASAQWNMAVDEALLYSFREGDLPIFRLYRWEEPSLSLGRFSQIEEVLEREKLHTERIPYVRRMTGGGILVHGSDISYSLVVPRSFIQDTGVKEGYRHLCRFLIDLYRQLGLDAAFAHDLQLAETQSPVCLAGTEAYDIIVSGRKIGGNAQRHTRQALLQHGSIPLEIKREHFEALFHGDSGLDNAASLQGCGIDMTDTRLTAAVKKAFEESYGVALEEGALQPVEALLAKKLYHEKYDTEKWNVYAEHTIQQT